MRSLRQYKQVQWFLVAWLLGVSFSAQILACMCDLDCQDSLAASSAARVGQGQPGVGDACGGCCGAPDPKQDTPSGSRCCDDCFLESVQERFMQAVPEDHTPVNRLLATEPAQSPAEAFSTPCYTCRAESLPGASCGSPVYLLQQSLLI